MAVPSAAAVASLPVLLSMFLTLTSPATARGSVASGLGQTEESVVGLADEETILREAESDPRNFHPDAFPVIRSPRYVEAAAAKDMDPDEWVIGVVIAGQPLAYPINVLNQHEIVIDTAGGVPFMVCWCPLCRTGMVYDRRLESQVLDFGHSGKLYRNAFLLYEVGTSSLWHHATGQALTGESRGRLLQAIPGHFVKWWVWRDAHPGTEVLAKEPGNPDHVRDSYAEMNRGFELTYGLGVVANGVPRLYEFSELRKSPLVLESVGGVPIAVYWHEPTETAVAWETTLGGELLQLEEARGAGRPLLREFGPEESVFDAVTGECVEGPRLGTRLRPVLSSFWEVYAWTVNHPGRTKYRASPAVPR